MHFDGSSPTLSEDGMTDIGATLLALSLLQGCAGDAPAVAPDDFRAWFEAASHGRLRIPGAVERRAARFRYVFVGGFGSEAMPGYFAQNATELRAHGVPRRAI